MPYEPKPKIIPNEALQRRQEMVNRIRQHLKNKPWKEVTWPEFYRAQEDLGYPLNSFEREMMGRR